jgi:hypothetical protein
MCLWANHGYEADYEILWQDGDGEFLDGSHTEKLRKGVTRAQNA